MILTLAPKEQTDNPSAYLVGVSPASKDSTVYTNTTLIPPNARGIWYVRDAFTQVNGVNTPVALSDHPEVKVRPVEITLPKTGKVTITVP